MSSDNIFSINHPELVYCAVQYYAIGHSEMQISLVREGDDKKAYLIFFYVEYFSGPMRWKGVNFTIRPQAECLNLLRELGNYQGVTDEEILAFRPFKLYSTLGHNNPVLIVASTAEIVYS